MKLKIKHNEVYHCPTKQIAEKFLTYCNTLGYKWISGTSFLSSFMWSNYRENTGYYPVEGSYGNIKHEESIKGYQIVEITEEMFKNTKLPIYLL